MNLQACFPLCNRLPVPTNPQIACQQCVPPKQKECTFGWQLLKDHACPSRFVRRWLLFPCSGSKANLHSEHCSAYCENHENEVHCHPTTTIELQVFHLAEQFWHESNFNNGKLTLKPDAWKNTVREHMLEETVQKGCSGILNSVPHHSASLHCACIWTGSL